MEVQAVVALVIGIVIVLFACPGLVHGHRRSVPGRAGQDAGNRQDRRPTGDSGCEIATLSAVHWATRDRTLTRQPFRSIPVDISQESNSR